MPFQIPERPNPPEWLKDDAKVKWLETWQRLDHRRFSFERDCETLTLFCAAYGEWREAEKKIVELGALVKDQHNRVVMNPWVMIRDTAAERITVLGAQLGLAPDQPITAPWDDIVELLGGDGESEDDYE